MLESLPSWEVGYEWQTQDPAALWTLLQGLLLVVLSGSGAKVPLVLEVMGFLSEHATIASQQILLAKGASGSRCFGIIQ